MMSVLRAIRITTHRRLRLTLRLIALTMGLGAAYFVSVRMEMHELTGAARLYGVVLAAALLEFMIADVLSDRSFPFDTERKLALMEKRLGRDAIKAISNRLEAQIAELQGCERSLV